MALEPITRQEKIIAGQDLTPITRMEMFLKNFGGGGVDDDVYIVKRTINSQTGEKTLEGDYAGAYAAYESGKRLKYITAFDIGGTEFVLNESFSFAEAGGSFKFAVYTGYNFAVCELSEGGFTDFNDETHVGDLYVDSAGGLFLKSASAKLFRVKVSDTGELSTEEIT